MSTKTHITKVWLPSAVIRVVALVAMCSTSGCSTLPPPGVDKTVWEHASLQYRARLHEEEAKRTREIEKGYIAEPAIVRDTRKEDEAQRVYGPRDRM